MCAPIKIGDIPYYMGVMLQRDTKTQRLYLHNVAIEKEASDISQADLLTTGADENNEYLFIISILQNALAVKYQNKPADSVKQKFSTRNTDSNRILLANALESTVQNEIEANKLREYKEKIALIDAKKFTYINYECELEGKHITLQIDIKIACKKQALGTLYCYRKNSTGLDVSSENGTGTSYRADANGDIISQPSVSVNKRISVSYYSDSFQECVVITSIVC